MNFINVYEPDLSGNERKYVLDCLDTNWISSKGSYIQKFENAICDFIGCKNTLTVSNGTVALQLALLGLGIGPGDEVIVPDFTYVASVNTILHVGATPVFADSNLDDWQVSIDDVAKKINSKTKAIMAVHLYGLPCDLNALRSLADKHGLKLIEDAAEAFGSYIDGRHVGTWGDVSTFSFFGNKTITTGEGGCVITNDDKLASRMRDLKNQYASSTVRYWHDDVGYNFRMTNIQAAIGLAQLERIDEILERKVYLDKYYRSKLGHLPVTFQFIKEGFKSSFWMCSMLLKSSKQRDDLAAFLLEQGIETRPFFFCSHVLPMFKKYIGDIGDYKNSIEISGRGLNLPSFPKLSDIQLNHITNSVELFFSQNLET